MASSKAGSYTAQEKAEGSHTGTERSEGSHTAQEWFESSHTAPERSEGSHTGSSSSDKVYNHLCGPCSMDGVDKKAKHYCQDCKQKICAICKDYHRKLAGTRNHTISPVNLGLATVTGNLGHMNISSDDAETKTVLLGRKVQSRSHVDVKADDDEMPQRITGCTVMTNGDVVLCDINNYKIKLLNSSGVLTGNMELSSYPWDASVLDKKDKYCYGVEVGNMKLSSGPCDASVLDPTSVIVTLPYNKQLQVVQVYPQLKPGRVIQLDKWCWGVAVGKGELYVTCCNNKTYTGEEGEIRVLGLDGKVKRRLGVNKDGSFMFTSPHYITVSSSGEKIFVSDYLTDTVTCMSVDGRVIYTYKDDSMRRPTGLLCDSEDNILVCGWSSDNVQVLTVDGKRHCTLLTEILVCLYRLKWPRCIAYRDSDNTLLVGCYNSDHLLSFQLTK